MDRGKFYKITYIIIIIIINILSTMYVLKSLLIDMEQRFCLCILGYYFFDWQGLSSIAVIIIALTYFFLWQITFQDPDSYPNSLFKSIKKDENHLSRNLSELPFTWLVLIFIWPWFAFIVIKLVIQLFIEPNFIGITDLNLYNFNWIFFGALYAIITTIGLYWLIQMFLSKKSAVI